METKYKLKPSVFTAPYRKDSSVYCPSCGHIMEQVLHIPKDIKQIYQCPRCNTFIPEQVFSLSNFK